MNFQTDNTTNLVAMTLMYLVVLAIFTFIFQYAWNYSIPAVFKSVGKLSLLQAFFLIVVARILIPNCPVVNAALTAPSKF